MRYDAEHKQRTREKIVRKAAEAIRQYGPDKIGVAGLMAKVGLTQGGFYAHFESKDDLVAEAISHMVDDRYAAFQKCLEGLEPGEGLENYIDLYLSTGHRDKRGNGCPVAALSGDLARMPAAARKRFDAGLERMTNSIADVLKALGRPQPESLAASIFAEMVGAIAMARAVSDVGLSERILDAARDEIKKRVGLVT
jgi:TetR/AcrR family transcriptional repressor of nem operon